jgi:ATP-binding cassette subfamily A (ABC1) protein 3
LIVSLTSVQKLEDPEKFEAVGKDFSSRSGIRIRKLRKQFGGFVAVNDLSLDMFEGEVFSLLGHNGAGKTTTISMLTGLLEISSGDASVFGYSTAKRMDDVQCIVGVCPQQNVLFEELSVREHLVLFASLRGITLNETEILKICEDVNLSEKVDALSSTLSGGQKRKLCVAIAFIGNPKVVYLDEPTAGMDPNSRRSAWDMIKRNKEGRIIVLTTHYMDEAELLGDRIGIMSKGQVVCCGSSLFLKAKYGSGYTLIVEKSKDDKFAILKFMEVVKKIVADAQVVEDAAREVMVRLPFSASSSFPAMFRAIDSSRSELGVSAYSISATSLEEVFLRVGKDEHDGAEDKKVVRRLSQQKLELSERKESGLKTTEQKSELAQLMAKTGHRTSSMSSVELWFKHFFALLRKRLDYTKRDIGYIACLVVVPAMLLFFSFISTIASLVTVYPSLALNLNSYNHPLPTIASQPSGYSVLSDNLPSFCQLISPGFSQVSDMFVNRSSEGFASFRTDFAALIKGKAGSQKESMYGAFVINDYLPTAAVKTWIYANQTEPHALPAAANVLTNSVLQNLTGSSSKSIVVKSHPMPLTYTQVVDVERTQGISLAFSIATALLFVPAAFIVFIVVERQTKAKHQQMISGVSITAYCEDDCFCFPF